MATDLNSFTAVFIARKPIYHGKKLLFMNNLEAWDCMFKQYPQGPPVMLRVPKDNPAINDLLPTRVYHFEGVEDSGINHREDVFTDLKSSKSYQIIKK